jgi:hypothetical protein
LSFILPNKVPNTKARNQFFVENGRAKLRALWQNTEGKLAIHIRLDDFSFSIGGFNHYLFLHLDWHAHEGKEVESRLIDRDLEEAIACIKTAEYLEVWR